MLFISTRKAVSKVLNEEMKKQQEKVKSALADVESLSVTMDIWSDASMRGFMGLTAHYTTGKQLRSCLLGVPRFQGLCINGLVILYLQKWLNIGL